MSESPPTQSMLATALRNIMREIPVLLDSFYIFAWDVLTTVIMPIASMVIAAILTWKVAREIWRIVLPPAPEVFYKEALGVLKKGDDNRTIRQAERLLKKSIKRDPTYLQSHLSLASLQLYQKDSPEDCLQSLDYALTIFPHDKALLQLKLDAQAVQQNMGHMATAGAVTVPYLGDIPFRQRRT